MFNNILLSKKGRLVNIHIKLIRKCNINIIFIFVATKKNMIVVCEVDKELLAKNIFRNSLT